MLDSDLLRHAVLIPLLAGSFSRRSLADAEAPPEWLWLEEWNGPANHSDEAAAVLALPDGSVLVAARTYDANPSLTGFHPALLRYDARGELLWSIVEPSYSTWRSLDHSSSGDALLSGFEFIKGEWNVVVRRLDPSDGSTTWETARPASPSFEAFKPAVVEDT